MIQVHPQKYPDYIPFAQACNCGSVYPLSIAQGYQYGSIYTNSAEHPQTALFHHACGFAFLSGAYDEAFLTSVYPMFLSQNNPIRRFILLTDDARIRTFFQAKDCLQIEQRYFFEYRQDITNHTEDLPKDYLLKPIDDTVFPLIEGGITPYFSWKSAEEFLTNGMGYCVVCGGDAAAWAFSAAISHEEVDIGVETKEPYRRKGLAAAAATAMVHEILKQNKKPVWACHAQNIGSAKLAQQIGFVKTAQCDVIRRKVINKSL